MPNCWTAELNLKKDFTLVKFIYSEKATNICESSTDYLSNLLPVKWLVEISQNFVAFSEYMNFTVPPSSFSSFLCYWDFVSLITPLTSSTIQILIQELSIYGSYSCTIYNSTRQYGSFNFEIWTFFFGLFHKSFLSGFFHSNRFGGSLFLVSLSQLPLSAWVNYLIMYCCVVLMY